MPSPGKRSFDEFAKDYRAAFPVSPPRTHIVNGAVQFVDYIGTVVSKPIIYQQRIQEAYSVYRGDDHIPRSQYMPGAYPHDEYIFKNPYKLPSELLVWGEVKLYNATKAASKAITKTVSVVIGGFEVLGTFKRRATQILRRRTNQEVIRLTTRRSPPRQPPPSQRQRPHRPPSPTPLFPGSFDHPEHIIEQGAPHAAMLAVPSQIANATVREDGAAIFGRLGRRLSWFGGHRQRRQQNARPEHVALRKIASKTGQSRSDSRALHKSVPGSNRIVKLKQKTPAKKPERRGLILFHRSKTPVVLASSVVSSLPPSSSRPEEVNITSPISKDTRLPSASSSPTGAYVEPVIEAPKEPIGTYNGLPDVSMHDATNDGVLGLLQRRVRFYESPSTGGPVSGVLEITPNPPRSPPTGGRSGNAAPSGPFDARALLFPDTAEDLASVERISSLPTSSTEDVEAGMGNEALHDLDDPQEGPNDLEAVESGVGLLAVSTSVASTRNERKEAAKAEKRKKAEEKKAREEAEEQKRLVAEHKRRILKRIPALPVITPLSAEWDSKVDAALKGANNKVVQAQRNLTRKDFATVIPVRNGDGIGYLNDEIINSYIDEAVVWGNHFTKSKRLGTPNYHAFNSFFYSNLSSKGPESVQKWSQRAKVNGKNLLNVDHVFIPINENLHWTLAVVSGKTKTIEYYDSLYHHPTKYVENIRAWIKMELESAGVKYDPAEWKFKDSHSPKQLNGIDCGVFTVTSTKLLILGVDPMAFDPNDAEIQRRRILAELMNGGFHGEFEPNVIFNE